MGNDFTDLIMGEFANKIRGLPNIHDLGIEIPVSCIDEHLLSKIFDEEAFSSVEQLANQIVFHPETGSLHQESVNAYLASRIPGHDLLALYASVMTYLQRFRDEGEYDDLNSALAYHTLFRSYCFLMPYLVSNGNTEFLSELSLKRMEEILKRCKETKAEIDFCISKETTTHMTDAELVTQNQLIRNAERHGAGLIKINHYHDGTYHVLRVEDNGRGFCDKEGKPFTIQEIESRFDPTQKGRLGLKLVTALAHSRKGYVEVITKTEGNPAIAYSTEVRGSIDVAERQETGTQFAIYIPKKEF